MSDPAAHFEMPSALRHELSIYDPARGAYWRDGMTDTSPSEVEILSLYHSFGRSIRAKTVVETGTYMGHATCFLAAAVAANDIPGGRVFTIDPDPRPHLWTGSWLENYITYIPSSSQDAAGTIGQLDIDFLLIDSIHTYGQSSWELQTFEPRVREGGYIVLHNSLLFDGVGRTVQHLADNPRFEVFTFETPRTQEACNIRGGRISVGCTFARKIRSGPPIARDPAWITVPEATPAGPEALVRLRALERSGA